MTTKPEEYASVPVIPVILLATLSLVVVLWMAQGMSLGHVVVLASLEAAKVVCMVALLSGIKKISKDM